MWKLNNNYLQDDSFCDGMTDVINRTKLNYAYMDLLDKWEIIKFEASNFAKNFASEKAAKHRSRKFRLYKHLSRMQDELLKDNVHEDISCTIEQISNEIDSYEVVDAKRAAFRCRKEWTQFSGKSTKYFFNLERRNFACKTMYVVKKRDGSLMKDYREILNEQFVFYDELYTRNSDSNFTIEEISGPKLDTLDRIGLDENISKAELFDSIMTLKVGKTQGIDGLGIEFYRKFWKLVVDPLHKMYMHALKTGHLSHSARRGIINLIPKKLKDSLLVKNYRPIVLLNYDFKIWAKALANRLDVISEKLINTCQ